jgi:hypothetical protein
MYIVAIAATFALYLYAGLRLRRKSNIPILFQKSQQIIRRANLTYAQAV